MEAILWLTRNDCRWRALTAEWGNWHTTYTRFQQPAVIGRNNNLGWHKLIISLNAFDDSPGVSMQRLAADSRTIRDIGDEELIAC